MKKIFLSLTLLFQLMFLITLPSQVSAYDPDDVPLKADEKPKGLESVGIKEKLGGKIDLSLKFTNEKGEEVTLASLLSSVSTSNKPTILSLVYYSCPNLCNLHLNGLTDGMKKLKWSIGKEYNLLSISFDSRESYKVAAEKKKSYLKSYARLGAEKNWRFLTGSKESIEALSKQVGFEFKWLEDEKEWSHASAAIMLTPEGVVSRYLHGVFFEANNLRLALIEAAQGKVGNIIDQIAFYCFRFDPKKNKYTLYAYNIMKAGATATVLMIVLFMLPAWIRERRKSKKLS